MSDDPTPDTPQEEAQPVPVRLSGGWHPDLNLPGLFLGQGTFEALRYPDGHLELVGVTLPPMLPPGALARAASDLPDADSAGNATSEVADAARDAADPSPIPSPDDATAAPEALDAEEAPAIPSPSGEAAESHESASEDEQTEPSTEDDAEAPASIEDESPPASESVATPEGE